MGMYCACGVKKRDDWKCECDWKGWFLCFTNENFDKAYPKDLPVKSIPEKEGIYTVRIFEDGDDYEEETEFNLIPKNWGEVTNEAISNWKAEYFDGWVGFKGVYAWKEKEE